MSWPSAEFGFNVIICNTDNKAEKEEKYIELLKQKGADGIIMATAAHNHAIVKKLIEQNETVAVIARDMPSLAVDAVLVDDFLGGYMAANHLMECGHQHMAVIAENLQVASSRQRVRGFRQAMEDAGLTLEERWIRESAYHVADGKQTAAALLAEPDAPTAVFACNDLLAIGVIQAARERGMAIPRDLSVVGFDNTILATIIDPPLTTIAQPIQEMGKQVVDLVARNIDGQSASKQRFVLLPELIVRGSTAQLNESASG